MRLHQSQPILLLRHVLHFPVSFPVMQGYSGQVIEGLVEVVFHMTWQRVIGRKERVIVVRGVGRYANKWGLIDEVS